MAKKIKGSRFKKDDNGKLIIPKNQPIDWDAGFELMFGFVEQRDGIRYSTIIPNFRVVENRLSAKPRMPI